MQPAASSNGSHAVLHAVMRPVVEVAQRHPGATELVVNGSGAITIKTADGAWTCVEGQSLSFDALKGMALAVAKQTAQSFNEQKAVLMGTLPTGERLTFIGPPVTPANTISLTMRLVQNRERTMDAYAGSGFFDRFAWVNRPEQNSGDPMGQLLEDRRLQEFLIEAVQRRMTIGVIGDTGSGKTFLMECLMRSIPADQRLVIAESARELMLPLHRNKVSLLYSQFDTGVSALDASNLATITKRMSPDWVLLGECIGPESFVCLKMAISGTPGLTSWHAKSLAVARDRFLLMAKEHADARQFDTERLGELFDQSFDVLVFVEVDRTQLNPLGNVFRHISEVHYRAGHSEAHQ